MTSEPCIVCQGLSSKPLFRTRDRHYGVKGEFDLVQCLGCGLVHLDPIPTNEELASFYAQDYYAYKAKSKSGPLKNLAKKILRIPIPNRDPKFVRTGKLLDVGCGSGAYLLAMQAKGWDVKGVEPSSYGAAEGRAAGLDIFNGTLHDANFPDAAFDYVRSNHSFEHVPNPLETISEMYRILKPGGMMFMGIPNMESLPYKVFGKYWWHLGAPLHTYNYGVSTITVLLQRAGFQVEKVHFNGNFASLTGSLQIYANRNNGKPSTQGWMIWNPFLMLAGNVAMWFIDRSRQGDTIEVICRKPE